MNNYFQCFDVPLTTGVNNLTLHVSDRAGNTKTTSFNVTLDYSQATAPPVVNLLWPQAGMAVSGSSCTIRGTMDDETGTIWAHVVNGDGTVSDIAGLVERNNIFWIENVPLNGTSQITLNATNAAGLVTSQTFQVLPPNTALAILITPVGDDLYQPSGTVVGTVGDQNAVVTVNGQQAVVDPATQNADGTYTWTATGAPIYGMGTATFDVRAVSGGGSGTSQAQKRGQA